MKKILVIANDTQTIIWFRKDMILGMIKKKCNVTIIAPDDEHREEIEKMGVKLVKINYSRTGTNPLKDIELFRKYKKIIKEEKPDKIFAYNLKPVIYGILAANNKVTKKSDCYAMIPGAGYIFSTDSVKARIIKYVIRRLYKKALGRAKVVFFQNRDDRNQFIKEKMVGRQKSIVVNGSGINLNQFAYKKMPDKVSFLFAARLLKTKGIIEYCKAAELVKKECKDIEFNIVGGVDDNPTCINKDELNYYIKNKIVNYYGKVDNMADYYENNAVMVLPSYHREGVPHAVLEAMSVGRIIITTNEIGCKETVKDGINGFMIDSKNSEMLAEKMKYVINHYEECKNMGLESRKYAEEKFDVKKVNNIIYRKMGI